jgi:signal transduction histidine kinase
LFSLDNLFYRSSPQEFQEVDLTGILNGVLQLVDEQLKQKAITVQRRWVTPLPVVRGNPDHLKQVFLNLTLNAIEAMTAQGGVLRVSLAPDQAQLSNGQWLPVVRLQFSDTGVGIPAENVVHIFEPFFSTKESGTGLGLSISYSIIEAHGGQIGIESQVGLGTTFTILLPAEQV